MNKLLTSFMSISLGLILGYLGHSQISDMLESTGLINHMDQGSSPQPGSEPEILYWVAPMDANYRRDKPGKSPMGMDLVPVYADSDQGTDGEVKISAAVQNNLGVRVSKVQRGTLNRAIDTVGYVGFDEEKISHVHTRVEGWVEKLSVKAEGEPVKKGQKLFEIYSPELVNAQEEYLTALKSKNPMLIKASKSRLSFLGIADAQIRQLDKTLQVRQRIDYFSPNNGFINQLNIREGMFIKPATEVLSVGQIDTVWVIAEVFERQSGWINTGQLVDMSVSALPGKTWQGTVDYIYPVLDAKTRTLRVRVRFENINNELKPNMYARLKINAQSEQETLYIPREALIRNGSMDRVVKSLGEGKFISVAVLAGIESDNSIEILKGLTAEDSIVTSAQFLIDSESSLSASFERMRDPLSNMKMETEKKNNRQAWIKASVNTIDIASSKLNLQHAAVEAWGWPPMMMDFPVSPSVDISSLKQGQSLDILVQKNENGSIEIIQMKQEQ